MPVLQQPGVALYYERVGQGGPVLLLNGIMMTTSSWAPQVEALAARHELILHDFRGQLRSPLAPGRIRMQEHVDDLLALMDHLAIGRASLVGTSYGGEVGMMFAASHPERVERLVVIACTSEADAAMKQRALAWARVARERPAELYQTCVPDIFSPEFRRTRAGIVDDARGRVARCPPAFFSGFADLVVAFGELNVALRLDRIRCPTLVIAPELDVLKPVAVSRRIADGIQGAELVVVEGAGHAIVVEQPERITAELERFLA